MQPILAVTCLTFEAQLAAGRGVRVLCATEGARLRAQLETETSGGRCCGIISFGVAGGLDPTLRAGDWVVGAAVVTNSRRFCTDETWARRLLAALPGSVHARISGVNAPISDSATKLLLRQSQGAAVVDMESHIAALVAARKRIPFAAARVVLDPAWRGLPPAALVPLRPDGSADVGAVLRSVWQTPSQMGDLLKVIADAWRAWAALSRGRRLLDDQFGFPHQTIPHGYHGRRPPDCSRNRRSLSLAP